MSTKTHQQLKFIFMMIRKLHLSDDDRKAMVHSITNGRSQSCADLSFAEARELCRVLNQAATNRKDRDKMEAMRKKIISCFHQINYRLPGGKIDMERVNEWIQKYGYLHKPLNHYTYPELPRLVSQVEIMRDKFLNQIFSHE